MKVLLWGVIGFFLGMFAVWSAFVLFAPEANYESALSVMLLGGGVGTTLAMWRTRRAKSRA